MQTFLPYSSYELSAACLDRARLQKQMVEGYQILHTILDYEVCRTIKSGWYAHPAVKMWVGYSSELVNYIIACDKEWRTRGYSPFILTKVANRCDASLPIVAESVGRFPFWLGDSRLHSSHRANLYRKDPNHYADFATPPVPYYWPQGIIEYNSNNQLEFKSC